MAIDTTTSVDVQTLTPFKKFIMTIGNLPTSYLESMTYAELLMWFCNYLQETVIPTVNNNAEAVEELQGLYEELQEYVNDYFDNLDVQEEINNKLDEMVEDGSLTTLIGNYVDPTLQTMQDQIDSVASGSPAGVYATAEALTSADPDHSKIYLVSADGKWYYYDTVNTTWTAGGVYQSSVNQNDLAYLLNVNSSSNEVNYDILSDIYNLSKFKAINKNNLVHLINNTNDGITSTTIGLNQAKLTGTASASSNVKISKAFTLKANTNYTFAILDYTYPNNNSLFVYLYDEGTNNAYKDSTNTVVRVEVNNGILNNRVNFTSGNADKSVQVGVYQSSGTARNHTFRVIILEGTYDLTDIKNASALSDTLDNRKFVGTCNPSTVIPSYNTPVFYLASGPGPYTNFNDSTVRRDSDYLLIYNNKNNLSQWSVQILPLLTQKSIYRQSILHINTSYNPDLVVGRFIWGIADTAGTYSHLPDYYGDPITLNEGEVAIISSSYDLVDGEYIRFWVKDTLSNIVSKDYVDSIGDSIENYVYDWLDAHPEATTTVEDGSITLSKLDSTLAGNMSRLRLDSQSSSTYEPNHNDLNTIVGAKNMENGIGSRNTIVGIENLQQNGASYSANYEIAIGYHSLFRDRNGDHNVSIGNEAMDNLSHGAYNTAVGSNAFRCQKVADYGSSSAEGETGNRNVAIGGSSMYYTYGDNNTAIGFETLKGSTYGAVGSRNVAIGSFAGKYVSNETDHLYIDNRDRSNHNNEKSKSLIYGTFNDSIENQSVQINGKFACNGKTPQAAQNANVQATDLQSAIDLVNQIRSVLIDTGILK